MPEHCILHCDSKALADMDGVMHKIEAVICVVPEGQMIYVLKILIFRNQNIVWEICFSRKEGKGKKARLVFEERL